MSSSQAWLSQLLLFRYAIVKTVLIPVTGASGVACAPIGGERFLTGFQLLKLLTPDHFK